MQTAPFLFQAIDMLNRNVELEFSEYSNFMEMNSIFNHSRTYLTRTWKER